MNKIDKLLEELCPEGVEYKPLGKIGIFTRGSGLQKKDFTEAGVGCIHYGQIYTYYGTSANETKSFVHPNLAKKLIKVNPGDIIIACTSENIEDVCKAVAWLGTTEIVTGGHACVFSHKENPKYISYFFQTENFFQQKKRYARGVKVIDVKAIDLAKIEIPIPPIEVQNEIVRILDKFASLAAELQAELQARQKQYEYYRNKLLTFTKNGGGTQGVTWMKMSELFDIRNGYTPSKAKSEYWDNGSIPWFRMEDIRQNGRKLADSIQHITLEAVKGGRLFPAGSFIIATTATIGEHALLIADSLANQQFTNLSVRKSLTVKVNMEFIYHYLFIVGKWCKQNTNAGGFASVDMNKFKSLEIPIPPLAEQERIAAILDRFERLTTDLQAGLPAEIKARQQQYEYYRDRLLTFKRKTA